MVQHRCVTHLCRIPLGSHCRSNINMKYYVIAGEASGDLHGSNLIKELHKLDPAADIHCWGGDKMQAAGATLVKHYRDLAFMGFVEVLKNLRTIFKNLAFCKSDIAAFRPDVLVLVDYPGFNLRIAKWAKQQGFKIVYYISPQVWAWKENRVKMMKQCIDKMLVILPFEKDYYQNKWNWPVEYVGHPLVQVVEEFRAERNLELGMKNDEVRMTNDELGMQHDEVRMTNDESGAQHLSFNTQHSSLPPHSSFNIQHSSLTIALLPGSRKQEILKKLPVMLEVSKRFPDYRFVVAKAPGVEESFYDELLQPYNNVSYVSNQTYALLSESRAALVTSGTATLETALFGVPEVICYKGNPISYQIAKRLISIKYIGLVNLIMDKEVVKELIQDDFTVDKLAYELNRLLNDPAKQAQIETDYAALWQLLEQGGNASARAAALVWELVNASK
jgi:lipid-A-disaccharide synthase